MRSTKRLVNLMQAAEHKIQLRKKRPADQNKWPLVGVDEEGDRDWHKCDVSFLTKKLLEEANELIVEASQHSDAHFDLDLIHKIRLEAGDVAAIAMMLADRCHAFDTEDLPPKVVCLCGSTKFKEEFEQVNYEETMAGNIVLSVGFFAHADAGKKNPPPTTEEKIALDRLHKRKIDLADEIVVVNVKGYVGESTRSEVLYARQTGKKVRWVYARTQEGMLTPTPEELNYSFATVKERAVRAPAIHHSRLDSEAA